MFATSMRAPNWPARLSFLAAGFFTLASGGTNLFYGIAKGTDAASSLVWATVSIGVSIIFALSWPAFIVSLDRRQWARAALVLIALFLTGTYSVTAALGSAMGGRANAAIEEKDTTDKRTKAQAAYDVAKAELATLKPSRPVAELEAMRKSWHERMCKKEAWFYEPELARAKRRADLEQKIERAAGDLANTGSAKVANSDAVALAAYLSALGIETSADRVNKLLVLLAVLVIECGGGLALAVGLALGDASRHALETQKRSGVPPESQGVPESAPAAYPQAFPASRPRSMQQQREPAEPSDQRLLRLVMERGGTLVAGQREIGRLIGVSPSHAHRLLHDLSSAGVVSLTPGRTGTVVKRVVN
jgi:uncharacterized membrane protein